MANLRVYIKTKCRNCEWALRLAQDVGERFPELNVEVVDLADSAVERPDEVFAVPTFVLNGRVLSLGNPRRSKLVSDVAAALEGERCVT